eukprot:10385255-Karenia_brevis.AAC.1
MANTRRGWRQISGISLRSNEPAAPASFFVDEILKDVALGEISAITAQRYCIALQKDGGIHPHVQRIANLGGPSTDRPDHNIS